MMLRGFRFRERPGTIETPAQCDWARNPGAMEAIQRAMERQDDLAVTLPSTVNQNEIDAWLEGAE